MTGTSVLSAGGRNVPDFRNSIGAQYGEFLGNGDNVGKLLEGNILRCVATRKGPYTLSLSVLTLLKN